MCPRARWVLRAASRWVGTSVETLQVQSRRGHPRPALMGQGQRLALGGGEAPLF